MQDKDAAEDCFVPAYELIDDEHFRTIKRIHTALKNNPWVRWRKPSAQRIVIHAADWHRMRRKAIKEARWLQEQRLKESGDGR